MHDFLINKIFQLTNFFNILSADFALNTVAQ